ncbi:MAG: tRNA (adenine-N1)-methyltransferase [Anaerolineales bacterium]|nr:MAG: tRNA (adenine-N1)-methyltransferase [Anaerolineales bacterium]
MRHIVLGVSPLVFRLLTPKKGPRRAEVNELALLVGRDRKSFILRLEQGVEYHTHRGVIRHDDLIGAAWGSQAPTHLGHPFLLLRPSTDDIVRDLKRTTQIIYPKDAGYILMRMAITSGCRVIEAGTGSGALTIVLAQAVGPKGRVYSYEVRPEMQRLARENLKGLGLGKNVEFKERDIAEGFDETDVDALFLDVQTPWDYLEQVHGALAGGGFFGCLLPTTNQVTRVLAALHESGFGLMQVEELLLRPYKAVPARLRPMDRMVAHTGYLIFARAIVKDGE